MLQAESDWATESESSSCLRCTWTLFLVSVTETDYEECFFKPSDLPLLSICVETPLDFLWGMLSRQVIVLLNNQNVWTGGCMCYQSMPIDGPLHYEHVLTFTACHSQNMKNKIVWIYLRHGIRKSATLEHTASLPWLLCPLIHFHLIIASAECISHTLSTLQHWASHLITSGART